MDVALNLASGNSLTMIAIVFLLFYWCFNLNEEWYFLKILLMWVGAFLIPVIINHEMVGLSIEVGTEDLLVTMTTFYMGVMWSIRIAFVLFVIIFIRNLWLSYLDKKQNG